MKKFKRFSQLMVVVFAMAAVMFSCVEDDFDNPDVPQIPIGDVYTIQQIKDLFDANNTYMGASGEYAYEFTSEASIYGTVIMDNETDNSYRTFFIQDATGGIAVFQDVSGGVYVGDSVRIYLKDLIVMRYSKLYQINSNTGDGVNVETNLIKQAANKPRTPEEVTIDQIDSTYQGRLVKVVDVQFVEADISKTYADPIGLSNENRILQDENNNQLIVRTSGYATFAGANVADGSGSIIGVVGQFNDDMQLVIRRLSELDMNGDRFGSGSGGGTGSGTGTKEDPYSVTAAISNNTGLKQWVKGYIVGAAEFVAKGNTFHFDAPFGSVNTNVMIADSPDETNSDNVMVVQLPSGTVRDILNLADNTGNHKKEVLVRGGLEDYFGQPGMKNTIGCIIDDAEYGDTEDIDAILYEDFASISAPYDPINIPGWKVVMEAGTKDWHGDGYNGQSAEISAYQSGEASNIAWLITPAVDLSTTTAPYLSFYSSLKYYTHDILSVYVSVDYDGGDTPQTATWIELTSANIVDNSDPLEDGTSGFKYAESGNVDLSSYKEENVYIAFKYEGSNTMSTKYRVDNVKISE